MEAAVKPGKEFCAAGGVFRDSEGVFLAAFCKTFRGSLSPLVAECLALREGLFIARKQGRKIGVAESDASNVVSLVRDRSFLWVP